MTRSTISTPPTASDDEHGADRDRERALGLLLDALPHAEARREWHRRAAMTPPAIEPCARPWIAAITMPSTTSPNAASAGVLESGTGSPMRRNASTALAFGVHAQICSRMTSSVSAFWTGSSEAVREDEHACPRPCGRRRASPAGSWRRGCRRQPGAPSPSPPTDHPGSRSSSSAGGTRSGDSRRGDNAPRVGIKQRAMASSCTSRRTCPTMVRRCPACCSRVFARCRGRGAPECSCGT